MTLSVNISTHAPHAGSDTGAGKGYSKKSKFQPTLPMRGATMRTILSRCNEVFQPTLPMRGATSPYAPIQDYQRISTHAPHAGSDLENGFGICIPLISTHAPHVGSDFSKAQSLFDLTVFQPTLPMRGATRSPCTLGSPRSYFNPRSPCGERQALFRSRSPPQPFQPTLPMRGATAC